MLNDLSQKDKKIIKTNYRLMQDKSIAECSKWSIVEHSAILSTFIKLPFVIKIFVSSILERLFYTGFTVDPDQLVPDILTSTGCK